MSTLKFQSTRSLDHRDLCNRLSSNPLVKPENVVPSRFGHQVVGILNPTFFLLGEARHLIVRVDEIHGDSFANDGSNRPNNQISSDNRVAGMGSVEFGTIETFPELTSIGTEPNMLGLAELKAEQQDQFAYPFPYVSHLRIAKLSDGIVKVEGSPLIYPEDHFSEFGCEDPRAVILEDTSLVTYTALGQYGATSWLARLDMDGKLQDKKMLQGPDHKHSTLFPEKIRDSYWMLSRPLVRTYIRSNGTWMYRSNDLIQWGSPSPILMPREDMWDSVRVGPCASPILIEMGWLLFYYGVDSENSYHVGAALLARENPARVIARTPIPLLSPVLEWERNGRRADAVFSCGFEYLEEEDTYRLYYGAADTSIGAADVKASVLYDALAPKK